MDRPMRVPEALEIIDAAKQLVALWKAQKVSGMPRSERNSAIEDVRARLIKAVESAQSVTA